MTRLDQSRASENIWWIINPILYSLFTISWDPGLGIIIFISDDLAVTISVAPMPLGKNTWQPSVLSMETVGTLSLIYTQIIRKRKRKYTVKPRLSRIVETGLNAPDNRASGWSKMWILMYQKQTWITYSTEEWIKFHSAMEQMRVNQSSVKCTLSVMMHFNTKHLQICALKRKKSSLHSNYIA